MPCQPDPSTKPPWTRTTFCTSVMDDSFVGRPRMRSTWSSATVSGIWLGRVRQTTTLSRPALRTFRRAPYAAGCKCSAQLTAGSDPELREHPVQVGADRAVREVQPLADLAV